MWNSNPHLQFGPAWESWSLTIRPTVMYGFCIFGCFYKYTSAHNSKSKVKQKILYGKIIFFLLYLLDFELFS